MTDEETVVVRTFSNEIEAEIARGHLETEGIQCFVMKHDIGGMWQEYQPILEVRLVVFAYDMESAENILKAMGT